MEPNDQKPSKKSSVRNQDDVFELIFGCGTDRLTVPSDFARNFHIEVEATNTLTIEHRPIRTGGTNAASSSSQATRSGKTAEGADEKNYRKMADSEEQQKENKENEDGPNTSRASQPSTNAPNDPNTPLEPHAPNVPKDSDQPPAPASEVPRQIEALRAANGRIPNAVVFNNGVRLVGTHPVWNTYTSPSNRDYNPYTRTFARRPTYIGINSPLNGFVASQTIVRSTDSQSVRSPFANNNIMAQNRSADPNMPLIQPPRPMARFPTQVTYSYPRRMYRPNFNPVGFFAPRTQRTTDAATQTSAANVIGEPATASHVGSATEPAPSTSTDCPPMSLDIEPTEALPPISTITPGLTEVSRASPDSTTTNPLSVSVIFEPTEQPRATVMVRPIPSTSNTATVGSTKRSSAECGADSPSDKRACANSNATVSSSDQRQPNPGWIVLDMIEINNDGFPVPRNFRGGLSDFYQVQVNAFSRMNDRMQRGAGTDFRRLFPELPLSDVGDIRRFDLSVRNRRIYLISYLTLVGGDTIWEVVGRVLARLMHGTVLARCIWPVSTARDIVPRPAQLRRRNLLDFNTTCIAQLMRIAVLYLMPGTSLTDIDSAFYCHVSLAISTNGRVHIRQRPRQNSNRNNNSESRDDNDNNRPSQEGQQNDSNGNNME